jgi:hypothetical protein
VVGKQTKTNKQERNGKMRNKSTMWVRRVVLADGQPVGKGRPNLGVKSSRTCLFIPLKETFGAHTRATTERPYNPAKNQDQRKQFKRTTLSALKPVVVSAIAPVEAVEVNAEITAPEAVIA